MPVAAGLLLMTLSGCGQGGVASSLGGDIITPTVESDIQASLPQVLGPAQSYSVTISGLDTTGHANEVDITGVNMQPKGAPVIATMNAQFLDVNYDVNSQQFTHIGAITMTLNVTGPDLTAFLVNDKGIPDTTVTFSPPNQLAVTGDPMVTGFGTLSLTIQGNLAADTSDGADVDYVLNTVSADGQSVTDSTELAAISALYNPIVVLDNVPAHAAITSITCTNDTMTIAANGSFP
jgi:hypothetical protein